MKKLFLLIALVDVLLVSCTVQDDRTGLPGNPNCPYCHGDGYFKKTDLLIFYTYYDCNCRSRYNSYDGDGYNVSFQGTQTGYTGECKKCDCPAYDRSADGICNCGHYKTDHTWHN